MVSARQDSQALSEEGAGSLARGKESRPRECTAKPLCHQKSKSSRCQEAKWSGWTDSDFGIESVVLRQSHQPMTGGLCSGLSGVSGKKAHCP